MDLNEVLAALTQLPEASRAQVTKDALEATKHLKWIPSPGPQTDGYFSQADVLLFGGEPGGGKSQLLLGLAFNCHRRSLIMRRQYTNLGALTDEAIKINGSRDGYNGSPPPKLRFQREGKDCLIEFGAAARPGDEQDWQGNPHDLIGFDEGTQFLKDQVRFLMGWLRSVEPGQRCRVVIATNPPMDAEGLWIVAMFAPWLDDRHPNPAKPGELRWFITDADGKDVEVDGPEAVIVSGKPVKPLSRTFIPSAVSDNPFLASTDYQSKLDAMIEPYRSILLGKFKASIKDDAFQVIPTSWIRAAQERWTPKPPAGVPMCAIGVDVAQGGEDETVLACRYDGWFAPLLSFPGKQTPFGKDVAGLVVSNRRQDAKVIIDMGGGYGGAALEHLKENLGTDAVYGYKGAEASVRRTVDKQLPFTNKRSEAYWRLREALDPSQVGGSPIMLPEDTALVADLTSPRFEVTSRGIKVESKEDVVDRLGRSPDRGDAVVMSWFQGPKAVTDLPQWRADQKLNRHRAPAVNLGTRRVTRR
jgi:hypothetical protein